MLRDTIDHETHAKVDLDLQNAYECCLRQTAIDSIIDKVLGMAQFIATIYS
jgi:hypothetical protein